MTGKTHKVFGILSNTLGGAQQVRDNYFIHGKDERHCAHVFGAIYEIDENGKAVDFTAIDFDGQKVRRWPTNTFGMDYDQFHAKKDTHFARVDKAIFFPITDETAESLKEAIDTVAERLTTRQNDYYPSFTGNPKAEYERAGRMPLDFSGKPREGFDTEKYERGSYTRPRIAINCMSFLDNVLEKIGGVPLDTLSVDGKTIPRNADTQALRKFIDDVVDNYDLPWGKKRHGRMVDLGEGRKAYFYNNGSSNGEICSTVGLNTTFTSEEGIDTSIVEALQQAKPLFDETLITGQMPEMSRKSGVAR